MRFFVLLLLAAGAASAQTTAMYRTIGDDGSVTFSDVPLNDHSEMITVLVRSGTATNRQNQDETATGEVAAPSEAQAAQAARNCELAREHQDSINLSDRLYRVLPNGEREFLTPEEVETARAEAQADVERWCE